MPRIWPLWTFIVNEGAGQAEGGERAFAGGLDVGVDRQLQVVAGRRRLGDELAAGGGLAKRVDLDLGHPRFAAQVAVVAVLDPALADLVAGFQLLVGRFLQLVFVDLADAAEHVGGPGPFRVGADEDPLHGDAGELALVLFQVVDEVVADVACAASPAPPPRLLRIRGSSAAPCAGTCARACRGGPARPAASAGSSGSFWVFSCSARLVRLSTRTLPVAVEDVAARGDHFVLAGAVVLGLGQVLGAGEDLEVPEPEEEHGEEGHGEAAEDGAAQRQTRRRDLSLERRYTALLRSQHRRPPRAPHGRLLDQGRAQKPLQAQIDRPAEDEGVDGLDQHVADDQAADRAVDRRASARPRRSRARRTRSARRRAAAAPGRCGSRSARGRRRPGSRSPAAPAKRRRAARPAGSRAGTRPRSRSTAPVIEPPSRPRETTRAGSRSGLTWNSATWEKKESWRSTPSTTIATRRTRILGVRIIRASPRSGPGPGRGCAGRRRGAGAPAGWASCSTIGARVTSPIGMFGGKRDSISCERQPAVTTACPLWTCLVESMKSRMRSLGVADIGPDHALDAERHDLGRDGAGVVGDQRHLGRAAGHRGDCADQAVAVDDRVLDLDPVAAADVDRHVGEPDGRRAGDHPSR